MFKWLKTNKKELDYENTYEYAEEPIYDSESQKTRELLAQIEENIHELNHLIQELKNES